MFHRVQVMGTDVGIETLDADIIAALLEDKESEKRQKQDGYNTNGAHTHTDVFWCHVFLYTQKNVTKYIFAT